MHFTNNKKKLCNENYSVMKNGVTTLLYPIKFNESTKSFKAFKPRSQRILLCSETLATKTRIFITAKSKYEMKC